MYYRVSTRAEDISEWGPTRVTGVNTPGVHGYAYPNPIRLSAEGDLIYLFWRGGNFQPSFSTSEDDGETWAAARTLIEFPGYRLRPYVKYATDGVATIHMAFTEAHPATYATSVYYLAYRAGALYRADGTLVASLDDLPVHPARADRVYDAAEHGASAWVYDVAHDEQGRPVIVYATFPSPRTDHRYRYARWTGDRWVDRELTPAGPAISRRSLLRRHRPRPRGPCDRLSLQSRGRVFEIEGWQTRDGGATWSSEASLPARRRTTFVSQVAFRGVPA